MATLNKDFKVKHGLNVAEGGTFGSTVTVATPTENAHATTKLYVDTIAGSSAVTVGATAFTLMFRGPSSADITRVKYIKAALLAPYAEVPESPFSPAVEPTFTIDPPPVRAIFLETV